MKGNIIIMALLSLFITACNKDEKAPINNADEKVELIVTSGTGGSISLKDGAFTCLDLCEFELTKDEQVIALATPEEGYDFVGWNGACDGASTCIVKMTSLTTLGATFTEKKDTLTQDNITVTTKVSTGGSITVNAFKCESDKSCMFDFKLDDTVSMTATPEDGYSFIGWGGACANSEASCDITVTTATSIDAMFTMDKIKLSVNASEGGTIAVKDSDVTCSRACEFDYDKGSKITLVSSPNDGYAFQGWHGACSGLSECTVTLTEAQSVTSAFSSLSCPSRASLNADHFDMHFPKNSATPIETETLLTEFIVKESSGLGVENQPFSMIFPVEQGKYFHHGDFHIKDSSGNVVPTQFSVINRWWAKDNSLRHIQAQFTVDVSAYDLSDAATGTQAFKLYAGILNTEPENPVCITETDSDINMTNGLTTINIAKNPLVITTPAGELKSLFTTEAGVLDESFKHGDITIELEEVGTQRSVVKLSSLTHHNSPTDIKHGWATRIYLNANSTKVQVDFQLQNSALNVDYSAPLYYQNHKLTLDNTGEGTTAQSISVDAINEEKINSGESGLLGTPNVNVYIRDFWQRFPLGISSTEEKMLNVELYPDWSNQFQDRTYSTLDMYWLDDMRQVYSEIIFDFTNSDVSESISKNFQYAPVAVIPQEYYLETNVTMELGGMFAVKAPSPETKRILEYTETNFLPTNDVHSFQFGSSNFGVDTYRKRATSTTGGAPYYMRHFYLSGNPLNYHSAQNLASGELNIRPQWLSGYTHEKDFTLIQPTANPYGGNTWRDFRGHGASTLSRDYLDGSWRNANPRDDQHAWLYHMEQAYLMSGNKWIKDWFTWIAEYKITFLKELDPWPDRSNRSKGHNVGVAVSAYRVTGNDNLKDALANYVEDYHKEYILEPYGISVTNKWDNPAKASTFQLGFLMKSFIELHDEIPDQESIVEIVKDTTVWNTEIANYSYYKDVTSDVINTVGSGTGLSFVDVAIWYSMYSGDSTHAAHAINFHDNGIGGSKPYYFYGSWSGGYAGQLYYYYTQMLEDASEK